MFYLTLFPNNEHPAECWRRENKEKEGKRRGKRISTRSSSLTGEEEKSGKKGEKGKRGERSTPPI